MAMLGAGDTARAAVPVMAQAFPLKEIRVTSRTAESRQAYAREIGNEYDLNVRAGGLHRGRIERRRPRRLSDDHFNPFCERQLARRRNHRLFHRQAPGT